MGASVGMICLCETVFLLAPSLRFLSGHTAPWCLGCWGHFVSVRLLFSSSLLGLLFWKVRGLLRQALLLWESLFAASPSLMPFLLERGSLGGRWGRGFPSKSLASRQQGLRLCVRRVRVFIMTQREKLGINWGKVCCCHLNVSGRYLDYPKCDIELKCDFFQILCLESHV